MNVKKIVSPELDHVHVGVDVECKFYNKRYNGNVVDLLEWEPPTRKKKSISNPLSSVKKLQWSEKNPMCSTDVKKLGVDIPPKMKKKVKQ